MLDFKLLVDEYDKGPGFVALEAAHISISFPIALKDLLHALSQDSARDYDCFLDLWKRGHSKISM